MGEAITKGPKPTVNTPRLSNPNASQAEAVFPRLGGRLKRGNIQNAIPITS
jgi:hypothetical protein